MIKNSEKGVSLIEALSFLYPLKKKEKNDPDPDHQSVA